MKDAKVFLIGLSEIRLISEDEKAMTIEVETEEYNGETFVGRSVSVEWIGDQKNLMSASREISELSDEIEKHIEYRQNAFSLENEYEAHDILIAISVLKKYAGINYLLGERLKMTEKNVKEYLETLPSPKISQNANLEPPIEIDDTIE